MVCVVRQRVGEANWTEGEIGVDWVGGTAREW